MAMDALAIIPTPQKECDCDVNPTSLYNAVKSKNWVETEKVVNSQANEASIWVIRKETNGKLRWRLLPLHAAVIFKAPQKTIACILAAYPMGAESRDDQGMLPIHLAFRNGASEGVVNVLLVAYPQSIEVKDRKGRVPLSLAQASSSPNKEAFIRALERGPSYYAGAAAATERAAAAAAQKEIFDAKLSKTNEEHKLAMQKLTESMATEQNELKKKIGKLENELLSAKGLNGVLTDHINAMEAQLESRSDSERLLVSQNKKLDERLKEVEIQLENKINEIGKENERSAMGEKKIIELENDNNAYEKLLDEGSSMLKSLEEMFMEEKLTLEKEKEGVQEALEEARKTTSGLELKMQKQLLIEDSLSSQLSGLTTKLAESNAGTCLIQSEAKDQECNHEKEKDKLKTQIQGLTSKLSSVASTLESMADDQKSIVESSNKHQAFMATASTHQEVIFRDSESHQKIMDKVQEGRAKIVILMEKQAIDMEESLKERRKIEEAVLKQEKDLKEAEEVRETIIQAVLIQQHQLQITAKELGDALSQQAGFNKPDKVEGTRKTITNACISKGDAPEEDEEIKVQKEESVDHSRTPAKEPAPVKEDDAVKDQIDEKKSDRLLEN